MHNSTPITAFIHFHLPPGLEGEWLDTWKAIGQAALAAPACREFRLLHDLHDPAVHVVLTEWECAEQFHAFAREAGFVWCERATSCASMPPSHAIFERIPLAGAPAPPMESRHLNSVR